LVPFGGGVPLEGVRGGVPLGGVRFFGLFTARASPLVGFLAVTFFLAVTAFLAVTFFLATTAFLAVTFFLATTAFLAGLDFFFFAIRIS
jgi:hypothetical protein